jgi:hypothetical protein
MDGVALMPPADATLATYVSLYIFPAAFALLPRAMDTTEARAMLIATGLQESKFQYRRQSFGGPARGFWQFEQRGGVLGVLTHRATETLAKAACHALLYRTRLPNGDLADTELHAILEHNDVLACVFARLLLWTLPDRLPWPSESSQAWHQYLSAWRPGKPHAPVWHANYCRAWHLVTP